MNGFMRGKCALKKKMMGKKIIELFLFSAFMRTLKMNVLGPIP